MFSPARTHPGAQAPRGQTAIPDRYAGLTGPATASARGGGRFNSARLHRLIAGSRAIRSLSIGLLARLELAFLAGHKPPDMLAHIRRARGVRRIPGGAAGAGDRIAEFAGDACEVVRRRVSG